MTRTQLTYLLELSKGQRLRLGLCCLAGLLGVGFSLAFIYSSKQVIDAATAGAPLLPSAIATVGWLLAQLACQTLHTWINTRMQTAAGNDLRHRLFARLLRSRWSEASRFHTGDVMNRIEQDSHAIVSLLTTTLPGMVVTGVQLLAAFLFFCMLDPTLPWIVAGVLPLLLPASRFYMRRMRRFTHDIRESDSRIQSVIQESLQHRTVVQTLEQHEQHLGRLDKLQGDLSHQVTDRLRFSLVARTAVAAIFSGGYLTAFLWGAVRLGNGSITFGTLTAFLQLVGKVQRPVLDLSRLLPTVVNALTAVDRLLELEGIPQEEQGKEIYFKETPDMEFRDVSFSYTPEGAPVLQHFQCRLEAGSFTAIMGETGKGKTTLIRLLLALALPDKGSVRLLAHGEADGICVSPRTRCNFVYVPQGNTLFSGTVRDNLLMGNPAATEEMLRQALCTAEAHFVFSLPQGMDTPLHELGGGLSEGQAQRIAIARALLRPGRILLLDEATSALDPETERQLMANLRHDSRGKSVLFVTHHPAVARACDHVVTL